MAINFKTQTLLFFNIFIILVALLGSIFLYSLFNSRETGLCSIYCGPAINQYQNMFLFFPFILLFSATTFFLPSKVFIAWWKFAKVAIPAIFLVTFLISLGVHHNPGGWMNFDNEIDLACFFLLYILFSLGSVIQIIRGYRKR